MLCHREIMPMGLSGPRFHAKLRNFTPRPGPAGVRRTPLAPNAAGALVDGI